MSVIELSSSASRRAAWRSRERTRYWCGVTPSVSENSRRKWNGLMPAWAAASSRSIGSCEWASIHSAVSTARRRSRAAFGPALRGLPETTSTKRLASTCPTSSRPMSLRPSAAACASSPSTISSGSGGAEPICQIELPSPIVLHQFGVSGKTTGIRRRRCGHGCRYIRRRDGRSAPIPPPARWTGRGSAGQSCLCAHRKSSGRDAVPRTACRPARHRSGTRKRGWICVLTAWSRVIR